MRRLVSRGRLTLALGSVIALGAVAQAPAAVDPLTLVSGPSPFAPGCNGALQSGTEYRNAEVEPHITVNLANENNLVGTWQQDRWSNGGASGQLSAYSTNGGQSWTIPPDLAGSQHGTGEVQPLQRRERRQRR